jgi:HSP20 family protein
MIIDERTNVPSVNISQRLQGAPPMFVSTTFPAFPLRTAPLRYGPVRYRVRTPFVATPLARSATPAVSGRWVDGAYELTADLPGVPQDSVAVSVADRTLVIDVATDELTWNERIRLPQTLDAEQVSARYADGRLTVSIAKTAEVAPRSIAIEIAAAQSPIAEVESTATSVTE